MNLTQLRYFKTLAEVQHYTKAAALLYISQPALTNAILSLEEELKAPLFTRKGRRIELNQFGKLFLVRVEKALAELDEGISEIARFVDATKGIVRLGFIQSLSSYFIPELITEFTESRPNDEVQFLFSQSSSESIVRDLKCEKLDIAFCSFIENEPGLEFVRLREQDLVLICAGIHPLASKNAVYLREIEPYPFISFSKESGLRAFIEKEFFQLDLWPQNVFEADDEIAIAGLVAHNKGVSIVPSLPFLPYLGIKMIPILDWPEKRYMYLTTRRDCYKAPIVQAFYDFCLERLR